MSEHVIDNPFFKKVGETVKADVAEGMTSLGGFQDIPVNRKLATRYVFNAVDPSPSYPVEQIEQDIAEMIRAEANVELVYDLFTKARLSKRNDFDGTIDISTEITADCFTPLLEAAAKLSPSGFGSILIVNSTIWEFLRKDIRVWPHNEDTQPPTPPGFPKEVGKFGRFAVHVDAYAQDSDPILVCGRYWFRWLGDDPLKPKGVSIDPMTFEPYVEFHSDLTVRPIADRIKAFAVSLNEIK